MKENLFRTKVNPHKSGTNTISETKSTILFTIFE